MTAPRIFIFLFCAFMLVTSREPPWADAHVVYDTTENFVDNAALDVRLDSGPPWFYVHRDGKKYGVFPLGNVVAMAPSYLVYKLVSKIKRLPDKPTFALAAHVAPSLMMAAACALFFLVARRRGLSRGWATGATLIVAFSTLTFIYARSPYSEALQTLTVMWLVERTLAMGERPTTAGIGWLAVAAGVLVNSKLVNVLFLPFVVWYVIDRAYRRGDQHKIWRALPLAVLVFGEFSAVALVAQPHEDRLALRQRLPDQERRLLGRSVRRALRPLALAGQERVPLLAAAGARRPRRAAPPGAAAAPRPRSSPRSSSAASCSTPSFATGMPTTAGVRATWRR